MNTALPAARSRASATGAAVSLRGVSRTYDGHIPALTDVTLDVAPGEFVGVTGPSGSGKSTLLQIIGSLDRPDSGEVLVDGWPVVGGHRALEYRRHVVGFVFQLHHLLPELTAQMNIEVALMPLRVSRRDRQARALELLDEVGLAHRAGHMPSQLSGGERQKVSIARALANRPRLLLADEPTGALDSQATLRVLDLLVGLQRTHGMTLLVVTHDETVTARADRLVHVVDGRILPR
jgi:putative ABC transport system ATP-binding protein